MADTIQIDPSPNRSTINAVVAPATDGVFLFTLIASTKGNGHGTPTLKEMQILIDGRVDKEMLPQTWQDGSARFQLTTAEKLKGGEVYSIYGYFKDENATAEGIDLQIKRST
jgi:hypothetical protein